ncbi:response regulator [Pseudenhygromyxa sp. WMMC2535]|uniref:response regulator transcription factor n=1 Tax=Pseudenhygromyxa sp. WMMC2535 TaxID=2712867 RepID=UPI001551CDE5|nr:response regulator [Pseudenhygromyxa sp. WMMC2535]NVB40417.1 response regulator [Pseudenhygromyxa sp. WMMC2535]
MSADSPSSAETIMIVDDDRAFCTALAGGLRRRGFGVVVAHDYDEALAEAEAWRPDRAVIDLRMPGHSGLEVVAKLRRLLPGLRMVVLTGFGSIATAIEAIKLGAVHYLTKPASIDELLAAFDRTEPVLLDAPAATTATPLDQLEWEHLQRVLTDCQGNVSEAARRLGMHRRSLQRKLARGYKGGEEGGEGGEGGEDSDED